MLSGKRLTWDDGRGRCLRIESLLWLGRRNVDGALSIRTWRLLGIRTLRLLSVRSLLQSLGPLLLSLALVRVQEAATLLTLISRPEPVEISSTSAVGECHASVRVLVVVELFTVILARSCILSGAANLFQRC